MPPDPERVIADYQKIARTRSIAWQVRRKRPLSTEREAIQNAKAAERLRLKEDPHAYMQTLFGDLRPEEVSFEQFTQAYLHSMHGDIAQCLTPDQAAFFERVHLRFLATGLANAQCVNADPAGRPLPFFLAFVNEGLYFALDQLFTALIFEEMQGDLATYRRDGRAAFEAAIRLYLEPHSKNIDTVPLELDDPAANGEVQAYRSSATTLVLQFVCLHEVAHAWLGHHDALDAAHLAMVEVARPSGDETNAAQAAEFEADAFAYRALMRRTKTMESNWAHTFLLHLFFRYLDQIEDRIGHPLSSRHPKPLERSERLMSMFEKAHPGTQYWREDLKRLDGLVAKWGGEKPGAPVDASAD